MTAAAGVGEIGPAPAPATIYVGEVVHERVRPRHHRLSYSVFSLLTDVDRLGEIAGASRLLSYNRTNLFSVHDRDHGPRDGTPIPVHARRLLKQAGLAPCGSQILMLAYPRMLGAVFNPLTVYYCFVSDGELGAVIYEVDNTVGERTSYVLSAGQPLAGLSSRPVFAHACEKRMYVSPFTPAAARYGFRVTAPLQDVLVGVHLRDAEGPLLRTHFRGEARPVGDAVLLSLAARFPLLAARVAGAIHIEALRLYWKGVPLVRRHVSPRYSVAALPEARLGDASSPARRVGAR